MKRYIITGAPGAGKTTILRVLQGRGYAVVDEAATDVIAEGQALGDQEPWNGNGFIHRIIALQRLRQEAPTGRDVTVQVFDRSPLCTLALARYLGRPVPAVLTEEIDRIARERLYERRVFFVRPIGFCEPTAARRITFQDSLEFERVHEQVYLAAGHDPVDVPVGGPHARAAVIDAQIRSWL